jgi:GT2 family glycosyltransferase
MLETPSRRASQEDFVDSITQLSSGVLLLAVRQDHRKPPPTVTVIREGRWGEAICLRYGYPLPVREDGSDAERSLLMVCIPDKRYSLGRDDSIVFETGGQEVELTFASRRRLNVDLKTFVRDQLGALGPGERAEALRFLARALSVQPHRGALLLSETLFGVREALRERLPRYVHAPDQPRGMAIDSIMAVDDTSFYMAGWLRDEEAEITRFDAVSPEGDRASLRDHLYTFRRPDVTDFFSAGVQSRQDPNEEVGFICFFELESPSFLNTGWLIEMENADGSALVTACPPVLRDMVAIRNRILSDPARDRLPDDRLMEGHVMPAMLRIAQQVEAATRVHSVTAFGDPPAEPPVSVIVPLYKRIDLIEQQLAEFTKDPEVMNAELIYVLDSPEQKDELMDLVSRLYPIYLVPVRIAVLQRNVGFANANNAGASIARAPLLLLMNSDVLPDKPGWLSKMASFYAEAPGIGALGPKLLYEDGSIQHAGMHFHQPTGSTLWQDAHYFKGLHRDFPEANVTRPVPLVSGACLMIARDLYEELGGLQARYVQGDYEDSDLCMRLGDLGLENWYLPEAELYHLEALSYVADLRMPANRYNAWLHTYLWRSRIESLARQESSPTGAEVAD